MNTIGQRFKKIRQEKNLSQEQFGQILRMTKSGISAVENDKVFVSVDTLRTLFLNFDVNLNWFVMGDGEMFNTPKYEDVEDKLEQKVLDILKKNGVLKNK